MDAYEEVDFVGLSIMTLKIRETVKKLVTAENDQINSIFVDTLSMHLRSFLYEMRFIDFSQNLNRWRDRCRLHTELMLDVMKKGLLPHSYLYERWVFLLCQAICLEHSLFASGQTGLRPYRDEEFQLFLTRLCEVPIESQLRLKLIKLALIIANKSELFKPEGVKQTYLEKFGGKAGVALLIERIETIKFDPAFYRFLEE